MGFYQPTIASTPKCTDLTGQNILITGGNTGLGFETALQLLRLGADHIVLGVRSLTKGAAAKERLVEDMLVIHHNPEAKVSVLECDLGDYASVVKFAGNVEKTVERLDVILLNAGVNVAKYQASSAGHETLIQVNYLSNALLALLLLPILARTPQLKGHVPTLSFVGSMGQHFNNFAKLPNPLPKQLLARLSSKASYSPLAQYPNSKLLVSLFVRELARHVPTGVILNSLCPGTVDTAADDLLPFYLRIPMNLNRRLRARTVSEGARTLIYASELAGLETDGKYISSNVVSPLAPFADSSEGIAFGEQLWEETIKECEEVSERRFEFLQ